MKGVIENKLREAFHLIIPFKSRTNENEWRAQIGAGEGPSILQPAPAPGIISAVMLINW
jgi:hypothetical protein